MSSPVLLFHQGVTAVFYDSVPNSIHPHVKAPTAFGGLFTSTDLVIVETVIFTMRNWRKVRHHNIGTGQDSLLLPSETMVPNAVVAGIRASGNAIRSAESINNVSSSVP